MDVVAVHAQAKPDAVAYVEDARRWTWRELLDRRNRLASSLTKLGLARGETAIVYAPNSLEYLLASGAVRAVNALPVPMNHRLVADEVLYILDHSDAAVVFVGDPFVPIAEQIRSRAPNVRTWILTGAERRPWASSLDDLVQRGSPEAPAVDPTQGLGGSMIYTGGTTGKPKGALRSGVNPRLTLDLMQALGMMHEGQVHLVAGPLYHSAPGSFALFTTVLGGTVVVMRKFEPEQALHLIHTHRVTSTFMAPTLVKRILDLPEAVRARYDVASMKSLVVAAAPCPMRVKEEALRYFGPCFYEFYGSTELGVNTILTPADVLRKPGSCGRAAPNVELALLDDDGRPVAVGEPGEVYIRRFEGMFDGYYKNAEATSQTRRGEWYSVGDVARVDAEGYYYIGDRKRDMIISAGVNIYPAEIEDALHRHPAVEDVAVFGVPDEDWGERVHAAIQIRPGHTLTADEVRAFAREHLADYKAPREVSFPDDFPRDTAGKLIKRMLRDPYWAGRDRTI
ncbi:MAG: acyl-CoA synthetase [Candidatus Rokuibacteriota bacterium]|nr:MAG: acyl-CoA synthetase [Candidatus Rokubacteria bacterium]